jgi:hypothetical protein
LIQPSVTQLFRRFIRSSCNKDETEQIINLLRSTEGRQLYGALMEETQACKYIEDVPLTDEQLEMSFHKLEGKIDSMTEINRMKNRIVNWQHFLWMAAL